MSTNNMSLKEIHRDGKYGFEDGSGLEVIPCKYDFVGVKPLRYAVSR